jgi:hypothetical protein
MHWTSLVTLTAVLALAFSVSACNDCTTNEVEYEVTKGFAAERQVAWPSDPEGQCMNFCTNLFPKLTAISCKTGSVRNESLSPGVPLMVPTIRCTVGEPVPCD